MIALPVCRLVVLKGWVLFLATHRYQKTFLMQPLPSQNACILRDIKDHFDEHYLLVLQNKYTESKHVEKRNIILEQEENACISFGYGE